MAANVVVAFALGGGSSSTRSSSPARDARGDRPAGQPRLRRLLQRVCRRLLRLQGVDQQRLGHCLCIAFGILGFPVIWLLWNNIAQRRRHRRAHVAPRPGRRVLRPDPPARPARAHRGLRRSRGRVAGLLGLGRARAPLPPRCRDRPGGSLGDVGGARGWSSSSSSRGSSRPSSPRRRCPPGPGSASGCSPRRSSSPMSSPSAGMPCAAARPATSPPRTRATSARVGSAPTRRLTAGQSCPGRLEHEVVVGQSRRQLLRRASMTSTPIRRSMAAVRSRRARCARLPPRHTRPGRLAGGGQRRPAPGRLTEASTTRWCRVRVARVGSRDSRIAAGSSGVSSTTRARRRVMSLTARPGWARTLPPGPGPAAPWPGPGR
jgi:hypothetical protein